MSNLSLIVVGEMNIDVIVSGLPNFPTSGQLINGERIDIGPGGKSQNIASMASVLMPPESVAMISKTVKDQHGLWELPIRALQEAGVNTEYVKVLETSQTDRLPGFAIILVDKQGNNEIIGAPGITRDLNEADINAAKELLQEVSANKGFIAFIGNNPIPLSKYIAQVAAKAGVRVLFDPGGADEPGSLAELLDSNIYLFKPNEQETEAITSVRVTDLDSAQSAATKILQRGVKNLLITAGANGAFLFSNGQAIHIPVPSVSDSGVHDQTGCGDQVMAAIGAFMAEGKDLVAAAKLAILTGTLQFHRLGIKPVRLDDLSPYVE